MLATFQRSLIYHPDQVEQLPAKASRFTAGCAHDVEVPCSIGTLHGWHVLPLSETAATPEECERRLAEARLVVLYFPGNAGNRSYRDEAFRMLSQLGVHVFLVDYRGYAENPGAPSEAGLTEDARSVWNWLTGERRVPASKIVVFGESLGGGVATRLAADLCREGTPPAGLALQSTFSSLVDAARSHFPWLPVRWVLLDTFRSDEAMPHVTCPLLHAHGTLDTIVPIELGRKLFAAAPDRSASGQAKTFVELPQSDHNDMLFTARAKYQAALGKFFEAILKR